MEVPIENYLALYAAIVNPNLSGREALTYFKLLKAEVPSTKNPKPSKELLEDAYINKKMTQTEISKEFNLSRRTISRLLKEYGIKARTRGEAKKY